MRRSASRLQHATGPDKRGRAARRGAASNILFREWILEYPAHDLRSVVLTPVHAELEAVWISHHDHAVAAAAAC